MPAARNAPRRPPALESYPRPETRDYPEGEQDDTARCPGWGGPPAAAPKEDYDEVFEDDGGSRQRASARDYQSAYGEPGCLRRRPAPLQRPWLLLLAMLAALMLTAGGWLVLHQQHQGCRWHRCR